MPVLEVGEEGGEFRLGEPDGARKGIHLNVQERNGANGSLQFVLGEGDPEVGEKGNDAGEGLVT